MADRQDRSDPVPESDFERRLFAGIRARQFHFPRAVRVPDGADPGVRQAWRRWGRRVLLAPAFAYGLALALAWPAYLGLSVRRAARAVAPPTAPSPAPPAGLAGGHGAELWTTRAFQLGAGRVRGEGEGRELTLTASDDVVLLSFLAPARARPEVVYQATLVNQRGQTVASRRPLPVADGRFVLACASSLLEPGEYVLGVAQVPAAPGADGPYEFPFRVRRSAFAVGGSR